MRGFPWTLWWKAHSATERHRCLMCLRRFTRFWRHRISVSIRTIMSQKVHQHSTGIWADLLFFRIPNEEAWSWAPNRSGSLHWPSLNWTRFEKGICLRLFTVRVAISPSYLISGHWTSCQRALTTSQLDEGKSEDSKPEGLNWSVGKRNYIPSLFFVW